MAAAKSLQQEQLNPRLLKLGWRQKVAGPRRIVIRGLARPESDVEI